MTGDPHYDVAISFAGEDRKYADDLATALTHHNVAVFYDAYEKAELWGKNLYTHLTDVYQNKARYCIMLLSQHYARKDKDWTNHERKAAQARAFREYEDYILPVRLDETEVAGILPTTGYLVWPPENAESIAEAVLSKLGKSDEVLRVAILLSDMTFAKIVRDSFCQKTVKHFPKAEITEFIGPTNAKGKEDADFYWSQKIQEILRRHSARPYHYFVPIGTQAAEKLSQALGEDYGKQPFLFLAVSDPVHAGLVSSLTARSGSRCVAGVAYGSGIERVIAIIYGLFSTKSLAFVYDPTPGLYTQDIAMAERLKATDLYRQQKIRTVEVSGFPKLSDLSDKDTVYFSWYTLETMFETGLGMDLLENRLIVASTERNVFHGLACIGVAPDDSEIGAIGAELLVRSRIQRQQFETMDIAVPKDHYWINTETANRLGVEFAPDVLKRAKRLFS